MGARVALTVSIMVLVFLFVAAPFVAQDEVAQALGVGSSSYRRRSVVAAFGERETFVRVSMDRGRVVVEAEVPDRATRSALLNEAASLYGRDQFVDLVSVVPDLKATPYKEDLPSLLPPALAVTDSTVVNLDGHRLSVQGKFASPERKQKYLAQLKQLEGKGVEVTK